METKVFWVETSAPGRLGTMPRPRGGAWLDGEITALARQNVKVLASGLTHSEVITLDLTDAPRLCRAAGIDFHHVPIEDRGVPDSTLAFLRAVRVLSSHIERGESVVTHCRMGIGRATLLAAGAMIVWGVGADEAMARIERARGRPVPDTQVQRDWLRSLEALERSGLY